MKEEYKRANNAIGHLSPSEPRTVVTVPLPDGATSSLATLYAQLAPTVRAPTQVAVRLEAELMGMRQLVATAAIPPGYSGIVAIATGIVADAWHGTAYGVLQRGSLSMSLAARPCCSAFNVQVPAQLSTFLTPRLQPATPAACMPLSRHEGGYEVVTGATGAVAVAVTERVLRIVAISDAAIGGLSGLGSSILHWPASTRVDFEPRGNAEGPRNLVFTNTTYYQVELVH